MRFQNLTKYFLTLLTIFIASCSSDSEENGQTQMYSLSVAISPSEGGSVSPAGGNFEEGQTIDVQAIPSENYEFVEWSGSVNSSQNPLTITMDSNKGITGVFQLKDTDGDGVTDDIDQCNDTPINEEVDETGCVLGPIYLDENGITIKCREWAQVGDSGEVNGSVYTIVDETMLMVMVTNGEDVTRVCTTKITDLSNLNTGSFNQDIRSWDVSNVIDMSQLFFSSPFNQNIDVWDVGSVLSMERMFFDSNFNRNIGDWDVSNVTNMFQMFLSSQFNQDIGSWNVGNVTTMAAMFVQSDFNQPIGDWDVSSVTEMEFMFRGTVFDQDIGNWDVSNVIDMSLMFAESAFNQDIGSWNVGQVENMAIMFNGSQFNQDINSWNVSNVLSMDRMFSNSPFNKPLGNWDVNNVLDMSGMFGGTPFNQPLENWNVSNVISMNTMFFGASFNQDIGSWDVSSVTSCTNFDENALDWVLPKPSFTNCNP